MASTVKAFRANPKSWARSFQPASDWQAPNSWLTASWAARGGSEKGLWTLLTHGGRGVGGSLLTSLEEQVLDLLERVPHGLGTLGTLALEILENRPAVAAAPMPGRAVPTPTLGPHWLTADTSRKNWWESPRPATATTGALAASAPATRWGYFILK